MSDQVSSEDSRLLLDPQDGRVSSAAAPSGLLPPGIALHGSIGLSSFGALMAFGKHAPHAQEDAQAHDTSKISMEQLLAGAPSIVSPRQSHQTPLSDERADGAHTAAHHAASDVSSGPILPQSTPAIAPAAAMIGAADTAAMQETAVQPSVLPPSTGANADLPCVAASPEVLGMPSARASIPRDFEAEEERIEVERPSAQERQHQAREPEEHEPEAQRAVSDASSSSTLKKTRQKHKAVHVEPIHSPPAHATPAPHGSSQPFHKDDSGSKQQTQSLPTQFKPSDVMFRINDIMERIRYRDPDQRDFHEAVGSVAASLTPLFRKQPKFLDAFEVLLEPDRAITFRVNWLDDSGRMQTNRGFRVQFNSTLGPYKGGTRFSPSVTLSTLKCLGFEQTLKNSLSGLPLGGAKGGADFDPKGRSDKEILSFCCAYMNELFRYIGSNLDIPAGDMGVGAKEIGFLFGQYKKLSQNLNGMALTGKGSEWNGSLLRTEATGYGVAYMAERALRERKWDFKDKRCLLSGSGNVALYTAKKLIEFGAKVITLSDSHGYLLQPQGFTVANIEHIIRLKTQRGGSLSDYAHKMGSHHGAKYFENQKPWWQRADFAFPCATQNEIDVKDAQALLSAGVQGIFEGANLPCQLAAVAVFQRARVFYVPGKACNAGGVVVSEFELEQNAQKTNWTALQVDEKLRERMHEIYDRIKEHAELLGLPENFEAGANALGFTRLANAMFAQGTAFSSHASD